MKSIVRYLVTAGLLLGAVFGSTVAANANSCKCGDKCECKDCPKDCNPHQ